MNLKSYLFRLYKRQRGAVSPFLFGMLAGVAIFSAGIRAQAQIETERILAEQEQRAQKTADTYRRAMEGALMAETAATFGTITVDRLNSYVSKSVGGGTRSGADIAMGAIDRDTTLDTQRVMITTSDDTFVRNQVTALQTGGNANAMATDALTNRGDVVTFDTTNMRTKQVEATLSNMNKQAEMLYGFWAQNSRFPGQVGEYPNIAASANLTTFWGDPIIYDFFTDNQVQLRATTPWGQPLIVPLNMN